MRLILSILFNSFSRGSYRCLLTKSEKHLRLFEVCWDKLLPLTYCSGLKRLDLGNEMANPSLKVS